MKYWKFMDYCTDDSPSRNLIEEWLLGEDATVQAEFINVLNFLAGQTNWDGLREIYALERLHAGLWEIRFNVNTTEKQKGRPFWRYRPIGFRMTNREFVLLRGCKKLMETYSPLECFDSALDLKRKFESGRGAICDHQY
jgi:hypothetical protein